MSSFSANRLTSITTRSSASSFAGSYYQGILALTTNRIANCDTAFESRIHVSVPYPDLDESARRKVWVTFLQILRDTPQGAAIDIADEDVTQLSKKDVNGRQIKNIFNGARILAKEASGKLSMTHINLVLRVTNQNLMSAQLNWGALIT